MADATVFAYLTAAMASEEIEALAGAIGAPRRPPLDEEASDSA